MHIVRGVVKITQEVEQLMHEVSRPLNSANNILPTKLYPTNFSVDRENTMELNKIKGDCWSQTGVDILNVSGKSAKDYLEKNCSADKEMRLKIGAQVVLIRNMNDDLVNGSRGVVVGFQMVTPAEIQSESNTKNSKVTGSFKQIPLVRFEETGEQDIPIFPVEFSMAYGSAGAKGEHKLARWQIPLKLAWALTIHKSQGMSLDKVECHVQNVFDDGHVYVALSRCTTVGGLRVVGFRPQGVRVNQDVLDFYQKMRVDNGAAPQQGYFSTGPPCF